MKTSTRYDYTQIAKELQATAMGEAYYGNALYVALDIPGLTVFDRWVLKAYLSGRKLKSGEDSFALQDIANRVAVIGSTQ